ncbi:hypothetical protein [Streptomyces sp. NPDC101165]|uniref:hypothetical protein n=1 Tax=Streptomyces sp. NPDC101165 TaxID=3366119 RepID=UPI0038284C1E
MGNRIEIERHREIVTELLNTKAVDFAALGTALQKFGPSLALNGEDGFCGTGLHYIRVYRLNAGADEIEQPAALRRVGEELTG